MLTTVQGTYENGVVRLNEPVPTILKGQVIVTFLPETPTPAAVLPTRPRFSWDEALALTAESSGVSVSDAVIEEREESAW